VLAFDFDSDQTVVDAPDPALVRRIAQVLDAAVPHPWIGRQLFRLFQRAGVRDVRVVPHALCFSGAAGFAVYQRLNRGTIDQAVQAGQVSASEAAAWWAPLEQAAEAETFFSAVLGFIAAGHKGRAILGAADHRQHMRINRSECSRRPVGSPMGLQARPPCALPWQHSRRDVHHRGMSGCWRDSASA
jgi:hypothetical protein